MAAWPYGSAHLVAHNRSNLSQYYWPSHWPFFDLRRAAAKEK